MDDEDRQLAEDCWMALNLLRNLTTQEVETPEVLAATAGHLRPVALPGIPVAR